MQFLNYIQNQFYATKEKIKSRHSGSDLSLLYALTKASRFNDLEKGVSNPRNEGCTRLYF
jgi:hypothetical protein